MYRRFAATVSTLFAAAALAAPPPAEDIGLVDQISLRAEVSVNGLAAVQANVAVYDINGDLVGSDSVFGPAGSAEVLLDPADPGTYFVATWIGFSAPGATNFGAPAGSAANNINIEYLGGSYHHLGFSVESGETTFYSVIVNTPSTSAPAVVVPDLATFGISSSPAPATNPVTRMELYSPFGDLVEFGSQAGNEYFIGIDPLTNVAAVNYLGVAPLPATAWISGFRLSADATLPSGPITLSLFASGETEIFATPTFAPGEFKYFPIEFTNSPVTDFYTDLTDLRPHRFVFSGSDSRLAVYRESDGVLIDADETGNQIAGLQLDAGDYLIALNRAPVTYLPKLLCIGSGSGATGSGTFFIDELTNGRSATISPAGDTDFFRVTVSSPVELGEIGYTVQPFRASSEGSPDNTELALWLEDGTLVATNDDASATDEWSEIEVPAGLPAGDHVVAITEHDFVFNSDFRADPSFGFDGFNEETYELRFNGLSPVDQSGAFDEADSDYFRFTIRNPPDLGVFTDDETALALHGELTGEMVGYAVWNEAGTLMKKGTADVGFVFSQTLPAGVYYVALGGFSGTSFAAGFETGSGTPSSRFYDVSFRVGGSVIQYLTGALGPTNNYDFFRFEIAASACSPADIDADGDVDPDDIAQFVANFTDAIPTNADVDNDGDEDPDDIAAFVSAFVAGCA